MGVLGGIPGTTRHLVDQVDSLPSGSHWQVIGISLNQWPLVAAAITMGGNVRVGLEDNFYLEEGKMAKSNGDLVEKAARLCSDLGREAASVQEARAQLGLETEPAAGSEPRPFGGVVMTEVKAELVGNVWKITSKVGDAVVEDDVLMILESMKMEISVTAPRAGTVREIRVKETEVVKEGQVLVVLE